MSKFKGGTIKRTSLLTHFKTTEETTDIIEALKASLQVKGKSSKSTAAKAKGKIAIA